MKERMGITKTTAIIVLVVIIIVAALAGVIYVLYQPAEAPGLAKPGYVDDKELIFESGATFQWLDPHVSYYQYDYWILWHSVETLFWYNRDSPTDIIPWLAESYTESTDGLQYTIDLRQGITFQDGTPFNATSVWFSFNRILIMDGTSGDPVAPVAGSQAAWMVQQLVDPDGNLFTAMGAKNLTYDESWVADVLALNFVDVVDEYTVKINLATPTTQFLPIMAGPWAGIVSPHTTIVRDYEYGGWGTWDGNYTTYFLKRAGDGDTYFNLPEDGWLFGTGAYYVESVDPTTFDIVLKAYDDYWGGPDNMNLPPEGKERIETIQYKWVPSFTTRLLDLKQGAATGIQVPEVDIFSVVDRDKWLDEAELVSIIDGVTAHGVFPSLNTWWFDFNTNVTNPDGSFREWQPFADRRLRLAAASAVNMTFANIFINYRLSILANNVVPPGTVPEHDYENVQPVFSFDLDVANQSIIDAFENPLNSTDYVMHYYNGTQIPAGVVDNSFSRENPKTIQFYVQSGADTYIKVLTTMADNLNALSRSQYGLVWEVVIVPGGQQYTLASRHQIDGYVGGWIADYNHVLNWLQPMYYSRGTYFSWNLWNITELDDLYQQALAADEAGNITELFRIVDEMNTLANDILIYMVWWHDTDYFIRSSWLQGWWENTVYGVDLWSTMYYEEP